MAKTLGVETEKVDATNKIIIAGDRNEPIISAMTALKIHKPDLWRELSKVVQITLWDGYPLNIFEPTE